MTVVYLYSRLPVVFLDRSHTRSTESRSLHPCDGWDFGMSGGDPPMAMRAMTQTLVELDNKLTTLRAQLHDDTWEPDEKAAVRVEIDQLLEQRQSISNGTARGGHRG